MSKRVDAFLSRFHSDHCDTRAQTVAILGEDETLAFESLTDDAVELLTAVEEHCGELAFIHHVATSSTISTNRSPGNYFLMSPKCSRSFGVW